MSENVNAEQGVSAHWQTFGKAGSGGSENDAGCWDGIAVWWCEKMILVDDVDNRQFLCGLVESMWEELQVTLDKNKQIFYI